MKRSFLLILLVLFVVFVFLSFQKNIPPEVSPVNSLVYSLFPVSSDNCELISYNYYSLCYNEKHEQAAWVYYILSDSMIVGLAERKNYFSSDTLVSTKTATYNAYKKSGFDRGHLLPAADMKWDQKAMDETFYMSNISPQNPYFNRSGLWRKSESKVRSWVKNKGSLHVFVGGVLSDGLTKLPEQNISIPVYFYKILFDESNSSSVAFLLENKRVDGELINFVVSVDSIETLTKIDFFSSLPDSLENSIEKTTELKGWF
tara:strand:- start:399 stop:1175 length:777 start_codon:yes stop_codon:yes gene_type:complete